MHEATIATALLNQLEQLRIDHAASRIAKVHIRVGDRSGIEPAALTFAFEALATGSPAEGAWLDIEACTSHMACRDCGQEGPPASPFAACPVCGSLQVTITGGEELLLTRVEFSYANPLDLETKGA